MRFPTAVACLLLAACHAPESAAPTPAYTVTVEHVRLNALRLPEALVRVTNTGTDTHRIAFIKCLFYARDNSLIGEASNATRGLGPGASDAVTVTSAEQDRRPARAECRVDQISG